MVAKTILILCASAIFAQTASGQCIGNTINSGIITNGFSWDNNLGLAGYGGLGTTGCATSGLLAPVAIGSGGCFPVVSLSPLSPTGMFVQSENVIDGALNACGNLPFLSAVALEGQLSTAGDAGVSYSCGDGSVGIVSEGVVGAGLAGGYGYGLGNVGLLNAGWAGNGAGFSGCGCGRIY